jgi:hypothetical protein
LAAQKQHRGVIDIDRSHQLATCYCHDSGLLDGQNSSERREGSEEKSEEERKGIEQSERGRRGLDHANTSGGGGVESGAGGLVVHRLVWSASFGRMS